MKKSKKNIVFQYASHKTDYTEEEKQKAVEDLENAIWYLWQKFILQEESKK